MKITFIIFIVFHISIIAFAGDNRAINVDVDRSGLYQHEDMRREKSVELKPQYSSSREKHIVMEKRIKPYTEGKLVDLNKWYEEEPDSSIERYYCDEIDETDNHMICALTRRTIYCIQAPCPQPEPAWKNYKSISEACKTGKIIEYIKQPCR